MRRAPLYLCCQREKSNGSQTARLSKVTLKFKKDFFEESFNPSKLILNCSLEQKLIRFAFSLDKTLYKLMPLPCWLKLELRLFASAATSAVVVAAGAVVFVVVVGPLAVSLLKCDVQQRRRRRQRRLIRGELCSLLD